MAFDPTTVTSAFGFQDGFQTTLSAGINGTDTTIPLSALPTPTEGTLVIDAGTAAEEEIYYVSSGSGNVNVTSVSAGRGINGTSAVSHSSGATVKMLVSKASFQALTYGGAIQDSAILRRHITAVEKIPTGSIQAFVATTPPTGWLLCDGTAVSRATYATLFALISTTYGAGDTTTTFNLPNLKGKVIVGVDASQTEFDAIAETGGEKTHVLTTGELATHTHVQDAHTHTQAAHTHTVTDPGHTHYLNNVEVRNNNNFTGVGENPLNARDGYNTSVVSMSSTTGVTNQNTTATNNNATATNQNAGSSTAHNNLQPYIALEYIIKY